MRILILILLIAAGLYGGYWYLGVRDARADMALFIEGLEDAGWRVEEDGLSIAGFPSRIDTTLTDLSVTAPDGGFGFRVGRLDILRLVYRRDREIIAVGSPAHVIVGGFDADVESERLLASIDVAGSGELGEVVATADRITLPELDREASGIIAAIRPATGVSGDYDVYVSIESLLLNAEEIGPLLLEATLTTDAPLTRDLATDMPAITGFEIRQFEFGGEASESPSDAVETILPGLLAEAQRQ
ncbi:DUF2125 domain-containing protein [Pelagovum pacificum]|nr:DUF2125 domain-containing protein [Pelagovum pacificum]QQA42081.1 DUF2125 domain-containing protein [Pelagovum pacificum]